MWRWSMSSEKGSEPPRYPWLCHSHSNWCDHHAHSTSLWSPCPLGDPMGQTPGSVLLELSPSAWRHHLGRGSMGCAGVLSRPGAGRLLICSAPSFGNGTKLRSNNGLRCSSTCRRAASWWKAQLWLSFSALPHVLYMTFVKLFDRSVPGLFGSKCANASFLPLLISLV